MGTILKIIECKDSFKYEGPRFKRLGPESGEEFRDEYLIPWLEENRGDEQLAVDFSGTIVYTPSFLEEAFGGAVRKGYLEIKNINLINIPDKIKENIEKYIFDAVKISDKGKR